MIAFLDRQVDQEEDLLKLPDYHYDISVSVTKTYVVHYQSHRPISVRRIPLSAPKLIAVPSPARHLLAGIQQRRRRQIIEKTDPAIIIIIVVVVPDRLIQAKRKD
jgi:hypothetical protein